jgi:myo-inositol-1(or 4)-monophosphatase
MSSDLELAERAARAAGEVLLSYYGQPPEGVDAKSSDTDLVSDADREAERVIRELLAAERPEDGLLAEEGSQAESESGRRWIVDPLDGTRNYLSGAGPWSVCIALQDGPGDDDLALAVVHDPVVGETFSAISGEGAFLDGASVTASDLTDLGRALAGLSFDPSSTTKQLMADTIAALLPEVGDIRRIPAALDLAYLACGRLDCAVLAGTKLWDVAAGLLLAREAGVVLGGVDGRPSPALILAAAPGLWDEFSTCDAAEDAVSTAARIRASTDSRSP